ncbi:uncharacterized protein DUF4251 [Jejuia pallidilutea]|uniref:Uncharacterized protein DUF4251 n=1 Tax=Jejuia pallidilutea TaxID=504487 RepID=A0A362WYX9_9FLAO|nr:DUF4251 domain-containing protein [Jejuia pallidilutea]PQV47781.1 uncharacterized protein DUF4251 [Jejuia pallidilutea]
MKRFCLSILVFTMFFVACKSSKDTITPEQLATFNKLVASREFTIDSDWAYPQVTNAMSQVLNSQLLAPGNNASAINLIGNANFLTIKGDSVMSYLPYFGERQMQIAYGGTDGAIQFNGLIQDYEVKNGKNDSKVITFKAKSNTENFDVAITLFPNLKTQMMLRGASRFFIQYSGEVQPIEKNKKDS